MRRDKRPWIRCVKDPIGRCMHTDPAREFSWAEPWCLVCPECGNHVDADDLEDVRFCSKCGNEVIL